MGAPRPMKARLYSERNDVGLDCQIGGRVNAAHLDRVIAGFGQKEQLADSDRTCALGFSRLNRDALGAVLAKILPLAASLLCQRHKVSTAISHVYPVCIPPVIDT